MVRVEHMLEKWKTIRADTAQAVEDMPAGELGFQPIPDLASFRENAVHILQTGYCVTGMLLAGMEDFRNFREQLSAHSYPLPPDAGAAALAEALRGALERRAAELAAQPPQWWAQMITRWDGQRLTRLELLQTVAEHELTHRAQLFVYLRLKGIVPVTTRRRAAAGRKS